MMFEPAVQLMVLWFSATPGMDHRAHLALEGFPACTECHPDAERADRVWPATESHAICDGADCHIKDFTPAGYGETKVCTTCHVKKSKIGGPLLPFPPEGSGLEYYAEISHATHAKAEVREKLEDRCLGCHRIDRDTREVVRPGHGECAGCHDDKAVVKMTDCAKCHAFRRDEKGRPVPMGPRGRKNPCRVTAKFRHGIHRLDARRAEQPEVSCGTCHFGLERAESLAAIVPTHGRRTMVKACGRCHRPGQKTFAGQALITTDGDCGSCHVSACLMLGPAPSWHR